MTNIMKGSVYIAPEWVEMTEELPEETRILLIGAIASYQLTGKIHELPPVAMMLFLMVQPEINRRHRRRMYQRNYYRRKRGLAPEPPCNPPVKQPAQRQQPLPAVTHNATIDCHPMEGVGVTTTAGTTFYVEDGVAKIKRPPESDIAPPRRSLQADDSGLYL